MAFRLPDLPKENLHPLNKKHRIPFQRFSWSLRAIPEARTMIGCLLAPLRSFHGTGSPWLGGGVLSCYKGSGFNTRQSDTTDSCEFQSIYIYIIETIIYIYIICEEVELIYIYTVNLHSILECMYGKTLETSIQRLCI